ncbi:MAG: stage II sporulation protein R [Ectobacillus sp.]
MKKQIIAYLLLLVIGAQFMAHVGYTRVQANQPKVIPNEAIRLRILANSDSESDQALKRKVRDNVKAQIDSWVEDLQSFKEARRVIQSRLPEIEKTVAQTLKEEGSKQSFTVEFSKHIKFPTKMYGNFIYPAGEYEAVLVKLGKGEGANWWCVLFPPLCFLDFSSGTVVRKEESIEEAEAAEQEPQIKEAAAEKEKPPVEESAEEEVNPSAEEPEEEVAEKKAVKQAAVKAKEAARAEKEEQLMQEIDEENGEEQEPAEKEADEKAKPKVQVEEQEEVKVKFFIVEAVSALFSE